MESCIIDKGIHCAKIRLDNNLYKNNVFIDIIKKINDCEIGSKIDDCTIGGSTIGGSTIGGSTICGSTIGGSTICGSTIGSSTIGGSTIGSSIIGSSTIDSNKDDEYEIDSSTIDYNKDDEYKIGSSTIDDNKGDNCEIDSSTIDDNKDDICDDNTCKILDINKLFDNGLIKFYKRGPEEWYEEKGDDNSENEDNKKKKNEEEDIQNEEDDAEKDDENCIDEEDNDIDEIKLIHKYQTEKNKNCVKLQKDITLLCDIKNLENFFIENFLTLIRIFSTDENNDSNYFETLVSFYEFKDKVELYWEEIKMNEATSIKDNFLKEDSPKENSKAIKEDSTSLKEDPLKQNYKAIKNNSNKQNSKAIKNNSNKPNSINSNSTPFKDNSTHPKDNSLNPNSTPPNPNSTPPNPNSTPFKENSNFHKKNSKSFKDNATNSNSTPLKDNAISMNSTSLNPKPVPLKDIIENYNNKKCVVYIKSVKTLYFGKLRSQNLIEVSCYYDRDAKGIFNKSDIYKPYEIIEKKFLEPWLKKKEKTICFLLVIREELRCMAILSKNKSADDLYVLDYISVVEKHRRRGYAGLLMNNLVQDYDFVPIKYNKLSKKLFTDFKLKLGEEII